MFLKIKKYMLNCLPLGKLFVVAPYEDALQRYGIYEITIVEKPEKKFSPSSPGESYINHYDPEGRRVDTSVVSYPEGVDRFGKIMASWKFQEEGQYWDDRYWYLDGNARVLYKYSRCVEQGYCLWTTAIFKSEAAAFDLIGRVHESARRAYNRGMNERLRAQDVRNMAARAALDVFDSQKLTDF